MSPGSKHISLLDGWRALSISLVMGGHLLPLGPPRWGLNETSAGTGMVVFFTLSGFLITRFLVKDCNLRNFLIRRLLRIVPLAWVGMATALIISGGSWPDYIANFLFYANLPPYFLVAAGSHFWSLCVEMQFYISIAFIVAAGGRRLLYGVPLIGLAVTGARVVAGAEFAIATWFRVDEILAGATLALIYEGWLGERAKRIVAAPNLFLLASLVLVSAHPGTPLCYARPWLSAWMVGTSLYHAPDWVHAVSRTRAVRYVAETSYALYVVHGILTATWLASGSKLIKYLKRPLFLAATVGLAHLSTFYFERFWISLARKLTSDPGRLRTPSTTPPEHEDAPHSPQ